MGLIKDGGIRYKSALRQCWRFPGSLIIVASALLLMGDFGREWFRFDREAIGGLQFWRLVTGHFVHLGIPHFMLNAVGLIFVWLIAGREFGYRHWLIVSVLSIVAIDIGLWMLTPELQWYVGLSGILHGLLAAGIVAGLEARRPDALILGIGLLAKLAYEQFFGPLPGSESAAGNNVVVDAHLYGAVGGSLGAAALIRVRRTARI